MAERPLVAAPEVTRWLGDVTPDKRQRISLARLDLALVARHYTAHERADGSILLTPIRFQPRGGAVAVRAYPGVCMDPNCLNDSDHAAH